MYGSGVWGGGMALHLRKKIAVENSGRRRTTLLMCNDTNCTTLVALDLHTSPDRLSRAVGVRLKVRAETLVPEQTGKRMRVPALNTQSTLSIGEVYSMIADQ